MCFALRMVSRLSNKQLTNAVFYGLIISHIQYSILFWGASSKQKTIKRGELARNLDIHKYKTRNKDNRFMEAHRTKLFKSKPTYIGTKFFSVLHVKVKSITSDKEFRINVKNLLINAFCYSIDEFLSFEV